MVVGGEGVVDARGPRRQTAGEVASSVEPDGPQLLRHHVAALAQMTHHHHLRWSSSLLLMMTMLLVVVRRSHHHHQQARTSSAMKGRSSGRRWPSWPMGMCTK